MKTWLRRNLFRTWWDGVLTILFSGLATWAMYAVGRFVAITGRWEIIDVNLKLLLVGRFPQESLWVLHGLVVATSFWMAAALGGPSQILHTRAIQLRETVRRFGLLITVGVLLVLLAGIRESAGLILAIVAAIAVGRQLKNWRRQVAGFRKIPALIWHVVLASVPLLLLIMTLRIANVKLWGGFLINFYIAVLSILLCFPLGVLLALGRRSSFPIVRLVCATYIEVVRGAPLFVLLLLSGVALDFFLPPQVGPGPVFRAVTVFTLFTAAYLAEIIRGGLQSIPKGQTEAGRALGLGAVKIIFLVTLPQALRNVIPAQIGQLISLFKDTTLAGAALSIVEMLKVSEAITKQDAFVGQGYIYEVLAFAGLLFWVGSFVMSRESQRVEKKLGVGQR
jgi:general L-amino acid transport system permease protein